MVTELFLRKYRGTNRQSKTSRQGRNKWLFRLHNKYKNVVLDFQTKKYSYKLNNKLSQIDAHSNSLFLKSFETCENVTLFSNSISSATLLMNRLSHASVKYFIWTLNLPICIKPQLILSLNQANFGSVTSCSHTTGPFGKNVYIQEQTFYPEMCMCYIVQN